MEIYEHFNLTNKNNLRPPLYIRGAIPSEALHFLVSLIKPQYQRYISPNIQTFFILLHVSCFMLLLNDYIKIAAIKLLVLHHSYLKHCIVKGHLNQKT